jgi:lauroyl/myristoyl acyltransferase
LKPHYSQTFYRAFWFNAGVMFARVFGVKGARVVSRALAEMYRLTHPRAQAAVRENLALLCGPQLCEQTVRRTFHNFGATLADYFQLGARGKSHALALIESRRGFEHIQGALADGKGALLVTVHTGLFELGGVLMEEFKLPLVVLSLPEPSAALNHWRAEYRRGWGAETLEVGTDQFSVVDISRQLSQGKCVAILMDRPQSNGDVVFADFPHGRVPFSTGPVWLSLLTGAPLVAVNILATESGNYALEALPPLRWQWRGPDRAATVREYTLELANHFREPLCNHPDQWYQFVPLSRLYSSASA